MRRVATILTALAAVPMGVVAQDAVDGAALADAFVAGDTATVWAALDDTMRGAFGDEASLAAFRASLAASAGEEIAVLSRDTSHSPLGDIHDRVSRWSRFAAPIQVKVVTDAGGRISGLWVGEAPVAAQGLDDHVLQADLRLPFEGEWTVFWGGRGLTGNYHAVDAAQRYALDLVVARDGATFSGDPADPASYFCWGQRVLAPAAGTVVAVEGGLPDQPIGQMDAAHPAGNHVVIDLGAGEYLFLAHLRAGSLAVAAGQAVAAGDLIGLCGNSGNSSEPHLHLHVQDTPDLFAGRGIPAVFTDYIADGLPVARGEPERGQVIAPGGS